MIGVDPFMDQKMLGVTSALKSMEALAKRLLATDVSFDYNSSSCRPRDSVVLAGIELCAVAQQ